MTRRRDVKERRTVRRKILVLKKIVRQGIPQVSSIKLQTKVHHAYHSE